MSVLNKKICGLITAITTLVVFIAKPLPVAGISPDLSDFAADGASAVELIMRPGIGGFICEGLSYASPAPVWADGSLYLPLRAVAEAFGAEIIYEENGDSDSPASPAGAGKAGSGKAGAGNAGEPSGVPRITGVFMGNEFTFVVEADYYTINGADAGLPQGLRIIDETAYIPAPVFDVCVGTKTIYDEDSDIITIRLDDDGGIRDLSGLLGEIRENAVGDSYYNWRIDVPKKSMLLASSLRGDEVLIYSQLRNALIEIVVRPGRGNKPEYYVSNSNEITEDFYVESAKAVGTGSSAYVEATLYGYGTVGLARLFPGSRYDYTATVYVLEDEYGYREFDTDDFMNDNPYSKILDTFEIVDFDAGDPGIRDLTKVVDGKIEYVRYLDSPENSALLMPWAISAPPAWDVLFESDEYNIITVLGDGEDENLTVAVELMPPEVAIGEFLDNYAALDAGRFNGDAYELIESKTGKSGDWDILDIAYTLNAADDSFMFYERLIPTDGPLYRLRLKIGKQRFEHMKATYLEMLDTFEVRADGLTKTTRYLEKQNAALRKLRISDLDRLTEVGGGSDNWSSVLPGDWMEASKWVSDSVFYGIAGYMKPSIEAYIFVYYETYEDGGEIYSKDNPPMSAMEYAEALTDDEADYEDGYIIGEPESAPIGPNDYARIPYSRIADQLDYLEQYPGYPISGEVYILTGTEGVYFIYTELPYVFDAPLNKLDFNMFVEQFRASDAGAGANAGAEAEPEASAGTANKTARTGAVG